MPILSKNVLEIYNRSRGFSNNTLPICLAPFHSIYFGTSGHAGFCYRSICYVKETYYPEHSIEEIWNSSVFNIMREQFKNGIIPEVCAACYEEIMHNNFTGALSKMYDSLSKTIVPVPELIELVFSNNCNLECIMCRGEHSCNVRKNKDNLEPMYKVYDQEFINQFVKLIPSLLEVKFLGGEPMLIPEYYSLWDCIVRNNPRTKITVTTNGTIRNKKFLELIPRGNFEIIVSLDSLQRKTYQYIRKNAALRETMHNIHVYRKIMNKSKRFLQISYCPMTVNWKEMPDMIEWGNKNNIIIWFHTVVYPKHLSLFELPKAQLYDIVKELRRFKFKYYENSRIAIDNINMYYNYVENVLLPNME